MEQQWPQAPARNYAAWAAVRYATGIQWFVMVLTVSGRIHSQHNPLIE
jgi:hypothetical protein